MLSLIVTGVTLSEVTVKSIKCWIMKSLLPLEKLWLNYLRLYVRGLCGRTTSIGEALHWATKSSYDGVRSAMSISMSANTQMSKAE